jgi:hypothetical protein
MTPNEFESFVTYDKHLKIKTKNKEKHGLSSNLIYDARFDTNFSDVLSGKYDSVRISISSKILFF